MSKFVPLTVHIKVIPDRPGKRFEYYRDLQKISVLVYDAVIALSSFQFATPGGGQTQQFSDIQRRGGLGSYANGTAVKPQIGQSPAQLMLTGFYESTAQNVQQYSNFQRFSGGEVYSGSGPHPNDTVPVSTINSEVKTIKSALEAAITAALPISIIFDIFRIDYAGVIYGDRGFHFPQ